MNQTEYLPNEFFTLLTSKLWDEINDRRVSLNRYNILGVLRDTVDSGKFHMEIDWVIYNHDTDCLCKRMWNSEIIKALRQGFNQGDSQLRSQVSELYRKCVNYGMSYMCIVGVEFFGALRIIMRNSQRACDMRYSTHIPSEILGMHCGISRATSERIVSIFLLLP